MSLLNWLGLGHFVNKLSWNENTIKMFVEGEVSFLGHSILKLAALMLAYNQILFRWLVVSSLEMGWSHV